MLATATDVSTHLAVTPRPPGWLLLHIPLVIVAYLLLLAGAAAGLLFIVQERRIKRHSSVAVTSRLPPLDAMEQFIYRMIFASFPLLTLGMLLGGHWALRTRGRFWGWDPTETFSFVTWIIYAIYLGLRWGRGWRGRRSTYLALTGFAIILVTLVALAFFSPLHTPEGTNLMPFVLGLNHRTAPVALREKLAISAQELASTLRRLQDEAKAEELVCLSTCNRTEVYAEAKNRAFAREAVKEALQSLAGMQELSAHLYYHESEDAVWHLFSVASGLDSMVQGEHEILAQVKQAYQTAKDGGFTGKLMNVLFQRSLFVGKRVRTETGLGEGSASVGSVAVGMAERIFGSLEDRTVMILGAGAMAEVTAKQLLAQKAKSLLVANRTFERACELANQFGGTAMHFEEGLRNMANVDIVICSTAAPHVVITPEHVRSTMEARRGRSLFLIDIAMPRDVDPAVNNIENVYLYNIDDLQQIVNENQARRSQEAELATKIVEEETHEFTRWLRAHRAGLHQGLRHNPPASQSSIPAAE